MEPNGGLPAGAREYLASRGVTLDVRPTPSAAYTFGVLSEEGRPVAAALFPMADGDLDGQTTSMYNDNKRR